MLTEWVRTARILAVAATFVFGADLAATPSASSKGGAKPAKWDVSAKFGPTKDIAIDVTEGTWMNVTVHPGGQKLAFDLLGDIYELPMQGGEARPLTQGPAWDMQPTYSPDGTSIAFTSDRAGGDNIWLMAAHGGQPKALTSERFRLYNSPAWSGDSRYLVARKHFTSRRSLGAGEIWMVHRDGGQGVQMTKRPNQQKDVGEPALSSNGRWLYYSRDTTPGAVFQYNKDPNPGIFSIFRLDRKSGRTEKFLGGPGGAIRPTPSPDNRRIAYIRRVRGRSVLIAREIVSGREVVLTDKLDRDLQETWSIHGVYPAMAWTPDSQWVVYWAGGRLWRSSIHGVRKAIPFHVKTSRRVHHALRSKVAVQPKRQQVRALRWPRSVYGSSAIVFEALGRLWIQRKASQEPVALTAPSNRRQFTPAPSPKGKKIAFATWNDQEFGAIRVGALRPGAGSRPLTNSPGHYRSPAWSPDRKTIAFEKLKGGWLRSATWSNEPGIYVVSSRGGPMRRLTRKGFGPHFGRWGTRLYFHVNNRGAKRHELRSVGLTDRRQRVHATSKFGTELWLSPDSKWLAFREGYEAWLTPFSFAGLPVSVGPKGKNLPIERVSSNGASFLAWSGDSTRLTWSIGPHVESVDLSKRTKFRKSNQASPPARSKTSRRTIRLRMPASTPKDTVAVVGARILTMASGGNKGGLINDGTIVWSGDRIVAVGPKSKVVVPKNAVILQGKGLTVMPGLIDVHAHGAQGTQGIIPQRNWSMEALLAFGVTTIHDPSNHTETIFAASELQRAGRLLAPRIFSTGTILYGATAEWTARIETKDDALRHLRRLQAIGAFTVKSYNQPRRDQRQKILAAARELGMMVVPEGGALFMHNMTQVVDGHTGVEHALPIARCYADVLALWSKTDVGHTPTLGVAYGGLGAENYWYAHTRVDQHKRLNRFVPRWVIDPKARRPRSAPKQAWNHIQAARFAKELVDAGGRVQVGAHGQREGLAVHWELWSFVQGGMSPVQALRAGTLDGARYIGLDDDLGSVEPGKLADLAIVQGKPDVDIADSERVKWTVLGGRVYDASNMRPVVPKGPEPKRWFWQRAGHPSHGATESASEGCGCGVH